MRHLLMVVLVVLALSVSVTTAQDAAKPEAVGLRPDAPPYALHGPYWVGTTQIDAETEFHPTRVRLWYPAINPDGSLEATEYFAGPDANLPSKGYAIPDAQVNPEGSPYPLIIFSHGLGGGNTAAAFLCEHLASQGFIVIAINYADSGDAVTPADPTFSLFTRPKDVSWQIDYAEQRNSEEGSELQGMFDLERIAIIGHSYGGYTALAAGGARVDLASPTSWCLQYPDMPLHPVTGGSTLQARFCDRAGEVAELAGMEAAPEGVWPSWADQRIDALVSFAPWMPFFGAESATSITIPALVMYGSADLIVETGRSLYRQYAYDRLGSTTKSLVVFDGADHFLLIAKCADIPWLNTPATSWFCSDPVWDMDRAHDLANHFITAFLLATLKDDAEAAAALAPDAVSFPGIEYQAEGF